MIIDEYTDISNKKILAVLFRILHGGKVGSVFFRFDRVSRSRFLNDFWSIGLSKINMKHQMSSL